MRTRFGRGYGPVVRQTTECINELDWTEWVLSLKDPRLDPILRHFHSVCACTKQFIEQRIVPQLFKVFLVCFGFWNFSVFTRPSTWPCFRDSWIQSTPLYWSCGAETLRNQFVQLVKILRVSYGYWRHFGAFARAGCRIHEKLAVILSLLRKYKVLHCSVLTTLAHCRCPDNCHLHLR